MSRSGSCRFIPKTPLAPDVDFRRLAERYVVSGGDIKNAVIKAAAAAAAEPGPDVGKHISQRHFECATEEVLSAKAIMQQSLFAEGGVAAPDPINVWRKVEARWRTAILVALGLALHCTRCGACGSRVGAPALMVFNAHPCRCYPEIWPALPGAGLDRFLAPFVFPTTRCRR